LLGKKNLIYLPAIDEIDKTIKRFYKKSTDHQIGDLCLFSA